MEQQYNVVIGGGIAGLVWAMYHPDYHVLTDKIGGQFSASFQLGPKYLHKTLKTEKFLQDIGADDIKTKIIRVGFYIDRRIRDINTEENRRIYFEKTRGLSGSETYRSTMSGGDTEFEVFDIDVEQLINLLYERVKEKVIIDKIKSIDLATKYLVGESNQECRFDSLVITVPRPVFCFMIEQFEEAKKFVSYPTTFIRAKELPGVIDVSDEEFAPYDYVYFSQQNYAFHRITRIQNGEYCVELKGDNIPTQVYETERFVLKIGQLVQRQDTIEYPDFVKFFGRYAQWNHGIKTKELLEEC